MSYPCVYHHAFILPSIPVSPRSSSTSSSHPHLHAHPRRPRHALGPPSTHTKATTRRPRAVPACCNGESARDAADERAVQDLVRRVEAFPAGGADPAARLQEAASILNILSSLSLAISITPVYDALARRGLLGGYGSARRGARRKHIVEQGVSRLSSVDNYNDNVILRPTLQEKQVIARELPERTGLPLRALTPSGSSRSKEDGDETSSSSSPSPSKSLNNMTRMSSNGVQLVAIAVCWLCVYLLRSYSLTHPAAQAAGVDVVPVLRTAFGGLGIVIGVDQGLLNGIFFDSVYQRLNTGYRERIVAHEAGHFLVAYVFGLPIHRYSLSALDALRAGVPGTAATLFADDELAGALRERRLGVGVVNRYSVVAMAGIAAEALLFGEATGGEADVNGLVRLLSDLDPAWRGRDIRIQARWAAVVAVGVLQTERAAYDALRAAMREGSGVGECVAAVEGGLKTEGEVEAVWRQREAGRGGAGEVAVAWMGGEAGAGGTVREEELDRREREVLADMKIVEEQLQQREREGGGGSEGE